MLAGLGLAGGLADLGRKVLRDHFDRRDHFSSMLVKMFDAHEAPRTSKSSRSVICLSHDRSQHYVPLQNVDDKIEVRYEAVGRRR